MNEHKETLDFSLSMSHTPTHTVVLTSSPFFFYPSQKNLIHVALGFLHSRQRKQWCFEYDACWTRCLNQIHDNTNLHLLSVWGVGGGAGFPKTQTKFQNNNLSNRLFRSGLKNKSTFFSLIITEKKPVDDKWCFFCPGKCFKAILGHSWGYCS